MNYKLVAGNSLTALSAVVLAASLWNAPPAQAKNDESQDSQWSEWSAIGAGYIARRREPPGIDLPATQRRLTDTQSRGYDKQSAQTSSVKTQLRSLDVMASAATTTTVTTAKLWFYTTEEGLHRVSVAELALRTGKPEQRIRNLAMQGKISLTNERNPVPWHFDEESDSLWFAARKYDSFHTDADAYHFALNNQSALPMTQGDAAASAVPGAATPFEDSLHFEEEPDFLFSTGPVAAEPDADYWFWDYLYGGYKDQIEVSLQIPHPAASGTARISISLRGWTDLEAGDEHEVYARLNGVDIGSSLVWDGFDAAQLVASFDQGLLDPSGANTLTLHNAYAPGTHPGQYLDAIDISYSRLPQAEAGALWLHKVAAGTQRVDGFSSEQLVVIESPRGKAVLRNDALIESDGLGGWSASFDTIAGADYLVTQRGSTWLATIAPDFPSALASFKNTADYLIIAPREFSATAQALANYRGNRFSLVKVVWLDDIYDQFSMGREDPAAVTAFMRRVKAAWRLAPSVVTIIGNGSLDHKNRMGYADSFVPVSMVSTPWAIAASDDRLLANDGRNADRFAIGRIPITSDQQGLAYLDKLIAYESGNYGNERYRAVLVADNPDDAGDFHANSDQLAEQLLVTAGFDQVSKLYHPDQKVRAALTLTSTWETGYVSYDGHGSSGQVGDGREKFITASDAVLLQNSSHPIFSALTCAAGDYSWPGTPSLAGALVLNPGGGAVAALAPTGLSLDEDAHRLGTAFVDSLFVGINTIGDALLDAKAQTAGSISDFMPNVYSIVGEPAIFAR